MPRYSFPSLENAPQPASSESISVQIPPVGVKDELGRPIDDSQSPIGDMLDDVSPEIFHD